MTATDAAMEGAPAAEGEGATAAEGEGATAARRLLAGLLSTPLLPYWPLLWSFGKGDGSGTAASSDNLGHDRCRDAVLSAEGHELAHTRLCDPCHVVDNTCSILPGCHMHQEVRVGATELLQVPDPQRRATACVKRRELQEERAQLSVRVVRVSPISLRSSAVEPHLAATIVVDKQLQVVHRRLQLTAGIVDCPRVH